jgi:hypothetical protein
MEKIGRNDPCSCGSGKKFKKCCESKTQKKTLGSAQVLSGANKMSSFFQRHVTPITNPRPPEAPPVEAAQEVPPEVFGSATL